MLAAEVIHRLGGVLPVSSCFSLFLRPDRPLESIAYRAKKDVMTVKKDILTVKKDILTVKKTF